MSFTSLAFLGFFILVFAGYWSLAVFKRGGNLQNFWLVVAGYVFYGLAEWKMIPVLAVTTGVFYYLGLLIARNNESDEARASLYTVLGVVFGVGLLVYFKYLNFIIDGFEKLCRSVGFQVNDVTLNIVMPLGISFFTFRLISYVIEVHRQRIEPCRDLLAFSAYVAFFPTILAGPIDRPNTFLPQLREVRLFTYDCGAKGCRLILWGLFTKLCVADRLAVFTGGILDKPEGQNGISLLCASVLYPLEMYADFCGYSNIAIGLGALLGIQVTQNFNRPFFATNVAEYWRRWHMSLTSWLTDYVFMPLIFKFRNLGNLGLALAVIINLVLVGMWHGDNLTFAVFGLYHGLLFIPLIVSGSFMKKKKKGKKDCLMLPSTVDCFKIIGTYFLVAVGLVVFRAASLSEAWGIIVKIATREGLGSIPITYPSFSCILFGGVSLFLMLAKESVEEYKIGGIIRIWREQSLLRIIGYVFLFTMIFLFAPNGNGNFIYFQF